MLVISASGQEGLRKTVTGEATIVPSGWLDAARARGPSRSGPYNRKFLPILLGQHGGMIGRFLLLAGRSGAVVPREGEIRNKKLDGPGRYGKYPSCR
jgi:hypothetical protein